jgi:hypothetical protein
MQHLGMMRCLVGGHMESMMLPLLPLLPLLLLPLLRECEHLQYMARCVHKKAYVSHLSLIYHL